MFDRKHGSKESIRHEAAQTSKLMDGNIKSNDGKPEKFNYLSPLKNILRSKTKRNKTPKPDLIREAAVAAVETTMASLVPPAPAPPAHSSFSFLNSSSLNNNQSQLASKTETSKVLKIKKKEKTSKMSESNIHEIKSKYY